MVAKVHSSIYFYIIWLFCFRVTLDLAYDSILCTFSQMDIIALIKRQVKCFELIYDVIWYLATHFLNFIYLTFSRGQ